MLCVNLMYRKLLKDIVCMRNAGEGRLVICSRAFHSDRQINSGKDKPSPVYSQASGDTKQSNPKTPGFLSRNRPHIVAFLAFGLVLFTYQKIQGLEGVHRNGNKGVTLQEEVAKIKRHLGSVFTGGNKQNNESSSKPAFVYRSMRVTNSAWNSIWMSLRKWVGVGVKPNQYRIITSGNVSETSPVPEHIEKPDYDLAILNKLKRNKLIDIKSDEEIQRMRRAGSLAKHVLAVAKSAVKPGVTTDAVDKLIHREIISLGAYPSPLHYKGFPKSCCTSVNNVVCHGVPDDLQLVSGDIINIDVTVFFDGCHGDTSDTYAVGEVDVDAEKLIATTRECLRLGVDVCRPGAQFRSIAEVIERRASQEGFSVCRHFVGHGIGSYFHGPPNIFHFVSNRCDERSMEPGMVFTIEPILMEGQPDVGLLRDGWTVVSKDNARSAQAEHTVLITNQGSAILTL